jgi:hypothetical protein
MGITRLVAAAVLLVALAGCTAPPPAVEPVVVDVGDLQGATIEVPLDSSLVIQTGNLSLDSYTATVADPSIADFTKGTNAGDVGYYPGMKPKKVGETEVTLTNEDGGIQDVDFTLKVTPSTP